MRARHPLIVLSAAGAVVLGGCTMLVEPPPDPTVVTLFHMDGVADLDPTVGWFAERVTELSGGELEVEVKLACCGESNLVEEVLVTAVGSGTADLGWVGTRVLGDLGVHEFDALTAPMLIDDYALQQQVAESDAAIERLAALDRLDVRGLAVMPGPLRHPLAADAPVLTLADWQGRSIAAFHSAGTAEGLRALGADPIDVSAHARDTGLFTGLISSLENSLSMLDFNHESMTPYATTNLVLAPRISVLLANPGLAERLSADELALLQQAAADVVDRTGELAQLDQAALESACSSGARFSEASASDLHDMRDAVAGVYASLDADAASGPLYRAIVELKADRGPAAAPSIPNECRGTADGVSQEVALLEGLYKSPELSESGLRILGLSAEEARNAAGVYRFAFDGHGGFSFDVEGPAGRTAVCDGGYTVDGGRVTISLIAGENCNRPGGAFIAADFTVGPKRLTLTDIVAPVASDRLLFSGYSWTWIGS